MPGNTLLSSYNIDSFKNNIYSQCGEDGMVEEILKRIGSSSQLDGWCVEFGALDGIYLSNTYNLIENKHYKAVLIEGDPRHYKKLCSNIPQKDVIKICKYVTFEGQSTLDRILQATPLPKNFDFLSIDIDGCDYHIFESLQEYQPKIVCIEFNPTIPNDVEFVQPRNFSIKQGSSAKSIVRLAESMSYALVAVTHCNLLFVQNSFKGSVTGTSNVALELLRDDSEYKTFIFFGYDGTVLSNRDRISIPWHGIKLDPEHLQQIPRYLRTFGGDYSLPQKIFFAAFLFFKFPKDFPKMFKDKFLEKILRAFRTKS